MTIYFSIDRGDLTQNMLEKSLPLGCNNPYCRRKSTDGQKIILKYDCTDVPAEIFALYYEPMTAEETASFLADSDNSFALGEIQ